MPRDGSGIYVKPFPDVVEGTTIESTVHNGEISDIEFDLNAPRPIVAGGTGANNAHDAMIALSGEIAGQVVTNYNSFPFAAGSFASAPGATGAPEASNYYSGICHMQTSGVLILEARAYSGGLATGKSYVREKWSSWSAWKEQAGSTADLDAAYVNVGGDTMTGPLTVQGNIFAAIGASSGHLQFGTSGTKFLQYDGANFNLTGGDLTTSGNTVVNGYVQSAQTATTGRFNFGNTGTKYLQYDGTNFNLVGGGLLTSAQINATSSGSGAPTQGAYYFGNTGTKYLNYDGSVFRFNGGDLALSNNLTATGYVQSAQTASTGTFYFGNSGTRSLSCDGTQFAFSGGPLVTGTIIGVGGTGGATGNLILNGGNGAAGGGYVSLFKNSAASWYLGHYSAILGGASTATDLIFYSTTSGNCHQISFTDARLTHFGAAYKPGGGAWLDSSDARIKNVLGDYSNGLDAIVALQPVRFTYKGNDTSGPPANEAFSDSKDAPVVPYPNSLHAMQAKTAQEFIGLIAQQAEVAMPELVFKESGYIDGEAVTDLRHLDQTPLIFALINACKELKARIEALEAA